MAKRKDSVALFEVITATKKREEAAAAAGSTAPSVLGTPKWWFKSKDKRPGQAPANAPHDPTVAPAAAPVHSAPQLTAPAEPSSATPSTLVQRVAAVAPERVTIPPERAEGADPFGLDFPEQRAELPRRSWLSRFG